MTEQDQVNLLIAHSFEKLGTPYFLGGSIASSAFGTYRSTADSDFIAWLTPPDAKKLAACLESDFYADEAAMHDAIVRHSCFNVIHLGTMLKVDVFVPKSEPFSNAQMARRVGIPLGDDGFLIYLSSPEDTILAKLQWYRLSGETSDRQWTDILGVLKVQAERLEFDYLTHWAVELGVTDLLIRARDDAGV